MQAQLAKAEEKIRQMENKENISMPEKIVLTGLKATASGLKQAIRER